MDGQKEGKMLSSDYTGIGGQRNPRLSWDAPREFAPAGCNVECAVIFMNADGLGERVDRLLRHGSAEGIGGGRKSGMGVFTV